jgi:glycosyltransferase involved in cell wall biosynthesis
MKFTYMPEDTIFPILFLTSGRLQLEGMKENNKFAYFSRYYRVEIISAVNKPSEKITQLKTYNIAENIRLHPFSYYYKNGVVAFLKIFFYQILIASRLFYKEKIKFKIVVSPNPLLTGLAALIIGKATGAKSIIEVNGNFEDAFKYGDKGKIDNGIKGRLKNKFSKFIISFVCKRADRVKLLYENQLEPLEIKNAHKIKKNSFSDFTPISYFINAPKRDEKYILLLGYPWYLKGVDILIKAFKRISDSFPEYRLKIVGWCPEGREFFEDLAKGNSRIELCDPVYYDEVIPLMTKCSIYVLASRTEAMGRVLLEAMASKKPVIASNVGGVPYIIQDGFNGLLFQSENIDDLSNKLYQLLSDKKRAAELAQNGYEFVQSHLSEQCYIKIYREMINSVLTV